MTSGKGALSLNSIADVWKNVLDRLRSQLSETTINTWFDEVDVVTMEDSAFVLHCSNAFKKSTIEARFMSHIKAALKDIFSSDLEVKILDDQQLSAYHGVAPDRPGSLLESDAFTFGTYVVGPQNKMAYAAARAMDANSYAMLTDGAHQVSFDKVVEVMKKTGHDLPSLYKETGEGGLAEDYKRMWDTLHTR